MVNKGKSFAFTFSPNVLNNDTAEAIQNWLQKQTYAVLVFEEKYYKGSLDNTEYRNPHYHGQIWCNDARAKHKVKEALWDIGKRTITDWGYAEKKHCVDVKFAYNDDFVLNYCCDNETKTMDGHEVKLWNPPADGDKFYPTKEEQEAMIKKANAVDAQMYELEVLFKEWCLDHNSDADIWIWTVGNFLGDMMFKSRRIRVIRDPKNRKELCKSLFLYIKQSDHAYNFMSEDDKTFYIQVKELGKTNYGSNYV